MSPVTFTVRMVKRVVDFSITGFKFLSSAEERYKAYLLTRSFTKWQIDEELRKRRLEKLQMQYNSGVQDKIRRHLFLPNLKDIIKHFL